LTDVIRVNGVPLYSWNSFSFKILGIPFNGIKAFDYAHKRERTVVYGARRDGTPLGKTAGKYSVEPITLTVLRDTADKITTMLTPLGLGSYGDAEFTFTAQYIEPGNIPITVVGMRCTIDGEKDGNTEGTEEATTELTIGCLQLIKNGKLLSSLVRAVPV
jgi:hypothetical protein